MLIDLFAIIAPVFLIAAIGYAWGHRGLPFDNDTVTRVATDIGVPALVIHVLVEAELTIEALSRMAGAAFAALCTMALGALVILKLARQPLRPYLPALTFGNAGNMGLPVCLFAFGPEGLALAIGYFVVFTTMLFTMGESVASGRFAAKQIARSRVVLSVIVAVILMAADVTLPAWLGNTLELLGRMTIPLMLLTLGVSLGRLQASSLGRSAILAVLRLGLGFAAGYLVATIGGLQGVERSVVILQSSMPVAVFNYLFAMRYDNRPEEVAGMVVISTALSFATLPLLLLLL